MSPEVKQCEETMIDKESETTVGINQRNRIRKWGRGYSKCVHARTRQSKGQKFGHKTFAYMTSNNFSERHIRNDNFEDTQYCLHLCQ